jgi:hypothetical protein
MACASLLDLRRWPPRQITVVAFTKASITDNRKRAIAERDLSGAKRTRESRAVDNSVMIVTPTHAEHAGLFFSSGRGAHVEPAGGKTRLIVEADLALFTKIDLSDATGFRREAAL